MVINKKNKKVHLIGICGRGMCPLAILFKESGYEVTGSDEDVFEPSPSYLKKNKILFYEKFNKNNIPKDVNLIVIGKNSVLSAEENPETRYALKTKIKIESLPEALSVLAIEKEKILVVGSFGKSSNAGLLAWCLKQNKKNPSYFIGAMPINFNSSHFGTGKDFIIEGDEYPSSNTDRQSKFLHFNPSSVLLISAEHDHINMFPTEESYKETYKKLMIKIPQNGLLVYALSGKNNQEISKYANCIKVSYDAENKKADWYAQNIKYGMQTTFDLMNKGKKIISVKTKLLGKHNIENIVGVGSLLLEKKKITPQQFANAVNSFKGIQGRIELKTRKSIVPVYDGFGSSFEKTRSVFDALHLHFPNKRLITIFEPHAFSWRNKKFLHWYKNVFENVDEVIMLPATGHGKKAKDQLNTEEVWREAKKHKDIHFAKNGREAQNIAQKIMKKGDVIALVSSGPMFGLKETITKFAEKKFRK
ncbi:MAG: Mur ligase family protein [Candidatus Paceibacterota bacterium]|jgi:UDP-N-acetylmuramate: L-alanyl-gamma-D-glutamyl-meso-diaminopimelate ligase